MSKLLCVLEQGKYLNHPITITKKELYKNEYCHFIRFNWKTDEDRNALYTPKNCNGKILRFSEGRNLLYDRAPKDYEYYMFMDEDVVLKTYPENTEDKKEIIKRLVFFLNKWNPVAAVIHTTNIWGKSEKLLSTMTKTGGPVPIRRHDACVSILHRSFSNLMYPIIQSGSDLCTIYQQWFAKKLFPRKFLAVPGLHSINSIEEQHHYTDDRNPSWYNKAAAEFEKGVIKGSYLNYLKCRDVITEYEFKLKPDPNPIIVNINHINKIFDVNYLDFLKTRKYYK